MNKIALKIFLFSLFVLLFAGCRKKDWDAFYNRPAGLADPMYQQLAGRGNFKSLLALIDKSGYKETLSTGAGYWTLFAPNDVAFDLYFKDKGISGVSAIDSATARAMVQYMLVYNAFEKDRLDDYQATENNTGWTQAAAFRRRTAYYTGFYKDTAASGPVTAIAANRNNTASSLTGNYVSSDYNNKYITYFTDDYVKAAGLSAADYNYFYPNSQYTGFNVAEAKVVTPNIAAENGVIHEIDRVVSPLMSIDEYIRTRPEYSSFRAILNRLYVNNMVQFIYNADATKRYQILTGKGDQVYVKVYSSQLAFAPNNENFLKVGDNDGQKDCWTMFIPNNAAVDAYLKNTLLEFYPSLDVMPAEIIVDFLNAHLFPTVVWPSKFDVTKNKFAEPARFNPATDIFDKKILSNGIVYGTTKVEAADVFSTVFSKAYLNPKYTFMTRLFNTSGLRLLIAKSNVPVNVFLIPDKVFADSGYVYNSTKDQFEYKGGTGGVADRLNRIVKTCVFFGNYKAQTDDLSGSDIVKSGDADGEGEFIKFNNNKVITAGLQDFKTVALVDSVKTAVNGKAYFLNNLLSITPYGIGYHIKALAAADTANFNSFWQLLSNSTAVYNATTSEIIGLNGFSTIFIPTNAAIRQAASAGILPVIATGAAAGTPNFNPTVPAQMELVRKFLQFHMLANHTAVPDGNTVPQFYDTYLKSVSGNTLRVKITNNKGAMSIIDNETRTVNVIIAKSNNLSNRSVIHSIDNYLKYNDL